MAFIENTSSNNEDPDITPDRQIQNKKGSWVNKGTFAIAFFVLAFYFAKDIGKKRGKKEPVVNNEWTLPKEDNVNWKDHVVKPVVIKEKNIVEEKIHEMETLTKQIEVKQKEKPKKKEVKVYESFRYKGKSKPVKEHQTARELKAINTGNRKTPDTADYIKASLDSIANANKPVPEKTLNERLETELLKSSYAQQIDDLDRKILQGKVIPIIIDFSIHTALPGKIRAYTSEPLYSQNGSRLLADQGSLLTGSYEGGMNLGVSRVFVVWERLLTSDGVAIELGSPVVGNLGRSGIGVEIDSHFWERFGSSVMLSVLNAGVSIAGGFASQGSSQTVQDIQANLNKSSEMALEKSLEIKPTGHLTHGSSAYVYVARDLIFPKSIFEN